MVYPSNQLKMFLGVPILLSHFSTNLDSLEKLTALDRVISDASNKKIQPK